ncbi:MAG TPA: peptidoglycan DD-metalloendopeptidase family protein [Beijerinckiaceae bacterium]
MMDDGRSRHAGDPGSEPPLAIAGESDLDRRDVNLRWLGASVLTGVAGATLLGAAIYVSVEGETTFAEMPELAVVASGRPAGDEAVTTAARKGDKLVRSETVASAKHAFKAPTTIRVGDREVIKVRPFVRIATGLSLTTGAYATDIPPFNPLKFFNDEGGERLPEPTPEVSDAEVSVVKRDLPPALSEAGAGSLTDDDALAQVVEERRLAASATRRQALPVPPQLMLSRTLTSPDMAAPALGYAAIPETRFNAIEVRVIPENVTSLPKLDPRSSEPLVEERDLVIKRGETLESVLAANGARPDQIRAIQAALATRLRGAPVPEGQHLKILVAPGPRPGDGRQVVRVILFGERGVEAIAAANDRGAFVSVAPPAPEREQRQTAPAANSEEEDDEEEAGGVRLYESLYETVLKNDLPRQTVDDLVRIFGYDVDFQRRVSAGDGLELFYAADEESGGAPEILSASLNLGGETRRVYRFQSPDDGSVDYFDELGRSLKKFLLRKPIADGQLRSGFGYRRHPILGYAKMHTGVDWSNRIGTPILSAGNGTVTKAEWDSGYGRRVEVQHVNGYVTAYSHQSRFAAGIRPGARVRQGQVIGYVGNTGLSTGPHLHYEVIVNGRFVDPMKIRLPRGRELEGRALAEFKRQKDQVDGLIEKAAGATRVAQRDAAR